MAESIKEKLGETVERAKDKVTPSGPPVATDAEGRVKVVREALKAFGDGDADAFLGAVREDVEWEVPPGGNFPGGKDALEGHDAVRSKFLEDARRTYHTFGFRPETYLESEDRDSVIVIGTYSGESNQAELFEAPGVQVWDFDRGQVVRIRHITDTAVFPTVVTEEDERQKKEQQEKDEKRERMEEKGEAGAVDEHGEEEEEEDEDEDEDAGGDDDASDDADSSAEGSDSSAEGSDSSAEGSGSSDDKDDR